MSAKEIIGDIEVEKTAPYWVCFQRTPYWTLGESSDTVWERRKLGNAVEEVQRYPNDYAGRIVSVVDGRLPRPGWTHGEVIGCIPMDLTAQQRSDAASRRVKVLGIALVPVEFADEYGAAASVLLLKHTAEEVRAARDTMDVPADKAAASVRRVIDLSIEAALESLPATDAHTGTGLYAVKAAPTHNDDTQDGAPAGQVITLITGGLGVADAFAGGYVVNATQAETRSIVSHTDDTITLEGNLAAWGTTDDLDIYDAWDTVQGACDRLSTDQGTTPFGSEQEVLLYSGTYTESVVVAATMVPTPQFRLLITCASGSTVVLNNAGLGAGADVLVLAGIKNAVVSCDTLGDFTLNQLVNSATSYALYSGNRTWYRNLTVVSAYYNLAYLGMGCFVDHCAFMGSGTTYGWTQPDRCFFYRCWFDAGALSVKGNEYVNWYESCVFSGVTTAVSTYLGTSWLGPYTQLSFVNCTFYAVGTIVSDGGGTAAWRRPSVRFHNCVVHTVTTVVVSLSGGLFVADMDNNCFYNVTNFGTIDSVDYTTLGDWQALTDDRGRSPDAHSVVANPLLTDPAAGDFSLAANSPCRHRGAGAGVVEGINGVEFDPYHPDIGAWSSGVATPHAYTSAG